MAENDHKEEKVGTGCCNDVVEKQQEKQKQQETVVEGKQIENDHDHDHDNDNDHDHDHDNDNDNIFMDPNQVKVNFREPKDYPEIDLKKLSVTNNNDNNNNNNNNNNNDNNDNDNNMNLALDNAEELGLNQMRSMCPECRGEGTTRMVFTKVPYFREMIVSSFACDTCGHRNTEQQFGGEIQEQGVIMSLIVTTKEDMNRQIIKSDSTILSIPDLQLEIPARTQRGSVKTIEGVLQNTIEDLQMEQQYREEHQPEIAQQITEFIAKLAMYSTGIVLPFTITLNDPAGNCFIENPAAPEPDEHLFVSHYQRTPTQDYHLGLQPTEEAMKDGGIDDKNPKHKVQGNQEIPGINDLLKQKVQEFEKALENEDEDMGLGRSEVIRIADFCPNCAKEGEMVTCVTDIPFFKEIMIMAYDCDGCGYKSNEIKAGGQTPDQGTIIELTIENEDDFQRDVLKGNKAAILIPEIELEVTAGSLGGFYTTVEGLLSKIIDVLKEGNPFYAGDSSKLHHDDEMSIKFLAFLKKLEALHQKEVFPFTIQIKDPMGNSFVSFNGTTPSDDKQLKEIDYERTYDENDDLGLNDMKTEGYETGYEHLKGTKILADRITSPHEHKEDHPTPFHKGSQVNDVTKVTKDRSQLPDYLAKSDKELIFEKCDTYSGRKAGMVFKLGEQGLGYYTDKITITTTIQN